MLLDDSKVTSVLLSSTNAIGGGATELSTATLVGMAGTTTDALLVTDGRAELKSVGVIFESLTSCEVD